MHIWFIYRFGPKKGPPIEGIFGGPWPHICKYMVLFCLGRALPLPGTCSPKVGCTKGPEVPFDRLRYSGFVLLLPNNDHIKAPENDV